MINTYIKLSI